MAAVGALIVVRQSGPSPPSAAVSTQHPSTVAAASAAPSPSPSASPVAFPGRVFSRGGGGEAGHVGEERVVVWTFNGVDVALAESGVGWYYTWPTRHSGVTTPAGVGFVRSGRGRRRNVRALTSRQDSYSAVSTSGPSAVIATVCSTCAARLPSALRMVQPSRSIR